MCSLAKCVLSFCVGTRGIRVFILHMYLNVFAITQPGIFVGVGYASSNHDTY